MRRSRAFPTVFWLVACLLPHPSLASAPARPNVVLVTIDTLRSDRLGCYGYTRGATPNIDQLASDATRFKTVVAQVPLTLPSHCTILTGLLPTVHQVRDNIGYRLDPAHKTLAELMKANGYQTAAFVGSYVLHSKFGLGRGFDRYDNVPLGKPAGGIVNLNQVERPAAQVMARALSWLKSRNSAPFLIWIHLYDPHDPYAPPAPFNSRFKASPYDGEVAYTDQEFGRLTAFLKTSGLYQNTILVLTGDHGESFGEHREYTHGYFLYDTTLLVPLLVKAAGGPAVKKTIAAQVSTVDIFPTILQLAGISARKGIQGRSLLDLMRGKEAERPREAYAETYYPAQFGWSELRAIRRPDVKYIEAPKPELYDLARDPGERQNLAVQKTSSMQDLRQALDRIGAPGPNAGVAPRIPVISPEERDRLAALGYISGPSTPASPGTRRPDPKDKLRVYSTISEAGQAAAKGRYAEAIPLLEKVLREEPGMPAAHLLLGRCRYNLEQFEPAREAFAQVLRSSPDDLDALFFIAACDFYLKRLDSAEAGLRKVLARDPVYLPAHKYLGFLYQDKGQPDRALSAFQRAVRVAPEDEETQAKLGFLLAEQSRFEEAAVHFRKAAAINPKNADTRYNLGVALLKTNQQVLGKRELAEACRLNRKYCAPGRAK